MKKVLIVTYYWIPSGGAGVQRWVKFTKYLRDFGYEPVVYAPENPEYPSEDYSFQKDIPEDVTIIQKPIWEPYQIYRQLMGKKGEKIQAGFISESKKSGWKDTLSITIRGNFLIPDPRRFWVRPSVKFLKKYLVDNQIDTVITTGPPHSMHLIGLGLKKQLPNIQWLADFRDPWTNIDFYKDLNLSWMADKIHHHLEKKVVQRADMVTVVSGGMLEEFTALHPQKIALIPNGYDQSDMPAVKVAVDKKFTISHIGTMNVARNPAVLWQVCAALKNEIPGFASDLCIQLVGKVDFSILEEIKSLGLSEQLLRIDYVPHHEAIHKQQASQLLLLLINQAGNAKGILTGKFFEYLASGRPVLGVGPSDGDAAQILRDTRAGEMVDFNDFDKMKAVVSAYYQQYKAGNLEVNAGSVEQYSRKSLTGKLVELLESSKI